MISFFSSLTSVISADPSLRLIQGGLLIVGVLDIYLLFWTLRDILLRTRSLFYQGFSLLLVTALPFIGFLCYLLIRPSRSLKEKEIEKIVAQLLDAYQKNAIKKEKVKRKSHAAPRP